MRARGALLLLSFLLVCPGAHAVNRYAKVDGNWGTPGTWSTNACGVAGGTTGVPQDNDDVIICSGVLVTLNVNSNDLASLTILAPTGTTGINLVTNQARVLTVLGNLTNAGTLQYTTAENHVINVGGQFVNNGTFTSANVNNDRTLTVGGLLTNTGLFRFHGSDPMFVNANGGIDNSGTFDVNTASNNTHTLTVRGSINNTGTFDLATGGTDLVNTTFAGTGTMTVSGAGPVTQFNRIFVNTGSASINNIVDVTATNFSLQATGGSGIAFTGNAGTFRLSAGVALTPFGTAAFVIPANGRFWLNHPAAVVTYPVASNISLTGGVLRIDSGSMTLGNSADDQILLNDSTATLVEMNGGTLNVAGRIASSGTGAGINGTFTMTGGTITVGTVGNTINNTLAAPFLLSAGTVFNMSGGTIVIERASTQPIPFEYDVRSTTSTVTGGTLQIGNGSTPLAQAFQINSVPDLWNLTIENATNNASLNASTTVNGVLTLTNGDLSTGAANTLTVETGGSIVGGSVASHVIGNLRKNYAAPGAFNFALGDGTNYTPVLVNCTSLPTPGALTVSFTATEHPDTTNLLPDTLRPRSGINALRSVDRYYTFLNPSLTGVCDVTFTYLASDVDAGATPASFVVTKGTSGCSGVGAARTCVGWSRQVGSGTPTNTQASVTGVAVTAGDPDADFAIGEPAQFLRERQFIYNRELY